MFTGIAKFFATPDDKDPAFIRLNRNILILTLIATLLSIIVVATASRSGSRPLTISVLAVVNALELIALWQVIRGNVVLAKAIVPISLVFAITTIALSANSIHDISIIAYPLIIIISALLQGSHSLRVTVPLTVLAFGLLGIWDMTGLSNSPMGSQTGIDDVIIGMVMLLVSAAILNLIIERLKAALGEAEANEHAQIEANRELTMLKNLLEERVEQRTAELMQRSAELELANRHIHRRAAQFEALALVARTIASVRDLPELLPRIAAVISEKFGFYHVGLFLLDEASEYAVMVAANSEGGLKMLERKHRLRVGHEGIVGYVTATGKARIAMDVGKDAVFFNNLELPDTHSEMALPLKGENRIMGALDVQSTESGAFTEEDVQMLSLLADQVSLAIENARLFDETRSALSEAEAISRQFTREAWGRVPVEHKLLGYRYNVAGAIPLNKPVDLKEMRQRKGRDSQQDIDPVVIPIELRGETIGRLIVQSPTTDKLNQDQIDLIKSVADRVALAAENARLFDETSRRAERERLVSDITSKIRSGNDPQSMIQTAMEELRKALGATRVEVIPQSVKGSE